MASSYKDIAGPVTCLSMFTVKPGYADAVVKYMADDMTDQLRLAEEGKLPGFLSMECVRNGDTFASWERYTDADAVEKVIPTRYMTFKSHPLAESFSGPPTIHFFATNSLSTPKK